MGFSVDHTGRKFGRLTALAPARTPGGRPGWRCRCDCGTERVFLTGNLVQGSSRSCGCWQRDQARAKRRHSRIDHTGKRYGRLTVLGPAGIFAGSKGRRYMKWKCRCACGNETDVFSFCLTSGNTQSCGCLQLERASENRLADGEGPLNRLLRNYRRGAVLRGVAFDLTKEEFRELVTQPCRYCGQEPVVRNYSKSSRVRILFASNGIDRVDNRLGYTVKNCVPCCPTCNAAKADRTVEEFLAWAERLARHQEKPSKAY